MRSGGAAARCSARSWSTCTTPRARTTTCGSRSAACCRASRCRAARASTPREKRLAVHTEDHPIEYLDFEAVIPEGNYGAGPMILWDRGAIRYLEHDAEEGLEQRQARLRPARLQAARSLRAGEDRRRKGKPASAQPEWLLIKKADAFARRQRRADHRRAAAQRAVGPDGRRARAAPTRSPPTSNAKRASSAHARCRRTRASWTPMLCAHRPARTLTQPGFALRAQARRRAHPRRAATRQRHAALPHRPQRQRELSRGRARAARARAAQR